MVADFLARVARPAALALLAVKAGMVVVSMLSDALGRPVIAWLEPPPSTTLVQLVALSFVCSSAVLVASHRRSGWWSTLAVSLLTGYGAATALLTGWFVGWSSIVLLTSGLLLLFALVGLVDARTSRPVTHDSLERTSR